MRKKRRPRNIDTTSDASKNLWALALRNRAVAAILDRPFADRVFGRVFLLNREELFPTKRISKDGISIGICVQGLPYTSHAFRTMFEETKAPHPLAVAVFQESQRRNRALKYIDDIQKSVSEALRDEFTLAGLKVVQRNPSLKGIVQGQGALDQPRLRKVVKDYKGLNFDPARPHVLSMVRMMLQGKSKKALNRMFMNVDVMLDAMGGDSTRLGVVAWTAQQIQRELKTRAVKEGEFRNLILSLAETRWIEQSSPIFLWCSICSDFGIVASVRSRILPALLPPLCPACGRISKAIARFRPAGPFLDAIMLPDGMLGAAVGWYLLKKKIKFTHGASIGGSECDFLLQERRGQVLLECKMNQILSGDTALRSTIIENRVQLRHHIDLARKNGVSLVGAACVVNLRRTQLRNIEQDLKGITDPDYVRLGTSLISYEDFPVWAKRWNWVRHPW